MDFSKRASCTAKDNARIALDGQSVHDSFMSEDEIEEIRESLKSTRGSSTRGGENWSANLTKYEHRRSHITMENSRRAGNVVASVRSTWASTLPRTPTSRSVVVSRISPALSLQQHI
jgi:hypothetical protein